jgi:hypothetical protein
MSSVLRIAVIYVIKKEPSMISGCPRGHTTQRTCAFGNARLFLFLDFKELELTALVTE